MIPLNTPVMFSIHTVKDIMKTQRVVAIIVIVIGIYLLMDAAGEYDLPDNRSEKWLGSIFVLVGIWLGLSEKKIL